MVIIEFYLNILKIFYFLVTHRTGQISELSFVGSFYVKFVSVMELQYVRTQKFNKICDSCYVKINFILCQFSTFMFCYGTIAFNF